MPALTRYVDMLVAGVDGGQVLQAMRLAYPNLNTLKTHTSTVRSSFYQSEFGRSEEYDVTELSKYAHEPGVAEFLQANLKDQVRLQRTHHSNPTWSTHAEAALSNLQLVKCNMASFKLSEEEVAKVKKSLKQNRKYRNKVPIHIPNAYDLLERAVHILSTCTPTDPIAKIMAPLLLVSGRRTTEIIRGTVEDSFEQATEETTSHVPAANQHRFAACTLGSNTTLLPNVAVFKGQLKTKNQVPYTIPLLCSYSLFARGMGILKEKIKDKDISSWTNKDINNHFSSLRSKFQVYLPCVRPEDAHRMTTHTLRKVYADFVWKLFEIPCSYNYLLCRILGHKDEEESLSYVCVTLEDMNDKLDTFGPLPIDVELCYESDDGSDSESMG